MEVLMVDRYTKFVLTIIAVALAVIAFRGTAPVGTANAQVGPVHVILDSVSSFAFQFATVPVRVTQ